MTKKEASIRIDKLIETINSHNRRYYVENRPTISDFEYDLLFQELQTLEKRFPDLLSTQSPTQKVGSDIDETVTRNKAFQQTAHLYPMLSLSNTYDKKELTAFDERIEKAIGREFKYVCELKLDGTAISLTYHNGILVKALTRGDGISGDDITGNVMRIKSIPQKLQGRGYPEEFEVRGEIFMPWLSFEKVNKIREENNEPLFANPRNAAAGSIKLLNPYEVENRELDCILYHLISKNIVSESHYDTLMKAKEWSLPISDKMKLCNSIEEINDYLDYWERERGSLSYATDGVVIKLDNLIFQEILGHTAKSPRWATAYKFRPEQAITKLVSIDYQVGRSGVITPVANLDPILLSGTVVKRATLHNKEQMESIGIHINDYVFVEKGGEIIPKITGVDLSKRDDDTRAPLFPTLCPDCGATLLKDPEEAKFYCPNSSSCPTQIKGAFLHFVSRKAMNILAGEATIEQLYKLGYIRKLYDLYSLNIEQLLSLDGWQRKSAERFIKSVEESKKRAFENVLYAIGIKHIGETTAKNLVHHFESLENLERAELAELISIKDIGETIAISIINHLSDVENIDTIRGLKDAGLRFSIERDKKNIRSDKLKGVTIVISGNFSIPRDELKSVIEEHSGKNSSSISNQTAFLLAGDKAGPNKLERALSLGVKIITEVEFFKMIND